jgi:DNA invertase Pin-like site-specific DNA recombinase
VKVTPQQTRIIRQMQQERETVVAIAKATGLSRPTVYSVL